MRLILRSPAPRRMRYIARRAPPLPAAQPPCPRPCASPSPSACCASACAARHCAPPPASVYLQDLSSSRSARRPARRPAHGHHPGRRHRAERRAHGAGQAQLPRAGAGRAHRRRTGQCAGGAGGGLCARRPASRRRPSTCATPARSACPKTAFKAVLDGAARSLAQHGFTDIVILGDSGNYQPALKAVAARLNRDWKGGPARAHFIADVLPRGAGSLSSSCCASAA